MAAQAEPVGPVERDQQVGGPGREAVAGLALDAAVEEFETSVDARFDRETADAAGARGDAVRMAGVLGEARGRVDETQRGGIAPGIAVAEQAALRRRQAGEPGRVGVVDGGGGAMTVAQGLQITAGSVTGPAEGARGRVAVREAEDQGAGADLLRGMEDVAVQAVASNLGVEGRQSRIAALRSRVAGTAGTVADALRTDGGLAASVTAVAGDLFVGKRRRGGTGRDEHRRERRDQGQAPPGID